MLNSNMTRYVWAHLDAQIYSINGDQLQIIGIVLFIVGLFITIYSKITSKETEIRSESIEREIKGYPSMINSILTPSYPTLLKIICFKKNRQNIVYELINNIQKEQGGRFARNIGTYEYKVEKICKKGKINFELDSNATYQLWVRPFEGVNKEGLDEVSKIFSKYTIFKERNKDVLNIKEPNRGNFQISIKEFTDKLQAKPILNLRGEELKHEIIANTGYKQTINDWYSNYPTIFDEIAEIIVSHSTTINIDMKYIIIRVEKPYEWLFHVGLTLTTISVVIFLAGFP